MNGIVFEIISVVSILFKSELVKISIISINQISTDSDSKSIQNIYQIKTGALIND